MEQLAFLQDYLKNPLLAIFIFTLIVNMGTLGSKIAFVNIQRFIKASPLKWSPEATDESITMWNVFSSLILAMGIPLILTYMITGKFDVGPYFILVWGYGLIVWVISFLTWQVGIKQMIEIFPNLLTLINNKIKQFGGISDTKVDTIGKQTGE